MPEPAGLLCTLVLPLLLACTGGPEDTSEPLVIDTEDPEPTGAIGVTPRAVDFGAVALASGPYTQDVTVSNNGEGSLHLTGIVGVEGPFTVDDPPSSLLPPGSMTSFQVHFDPIDAGEWNIHLWVKSDDPERAEVDVNVIGRTTSDEGNDTGV